MNNVLEELKKANDKMINSTSIVYANDNTIKKFDMNEIPCSIWFIKLDSLSDGQALLIRDKEMKEEMYHFCCQNPNIVFKGKQTVISLQV